MKNKDKPINPTEIEKYPRNNGIIKFLGLTKHEYFAALAMQGMLANPEGVMLISGNRSLAPATIAVMAIKQADELLKELES